MNVATLLDNHISKHCLQTQFCMIHISEIIWTSGQEIIRKREFIKFDQGGNKKNWDLFYSILMKRQF